MNLKGNICFNLRKQIFNHFYFLTELKSSDIIRISNVTICKSKILGVEHNKRGVEYLYRLKNKS